MAVIDIGSGADNYNIATPYAPLDVANPANDTGSLDTIEIWMATNGSNVKVGTFSGSGTSYTSRDYESIGAVTAGSKQTFSGLDCEVESGDFIGAYYTAGSIEVNNTGGTNFYYYYGGDPFTGSAITYTKWGSGYKCALYGTGATPLVAPTVTTQAATLVTSGGFTGNGNITDIGSDTPTRRGFCYKEGTSGDPTTSDSVAYDEDSYGTGAYTKAVTGLSEGTAYRVRAYATSPDGTGYGDTVSVTTETTVSKETQHIWNTYDAVGKESQALWNTLDCISAESQHIWNTLYLVPKELNILWDTDYMVWMTVLKGQYGNPVIPINRLVVFGRAVDDTKTIGGDSNTTEIGAYGEFLNIEYEPAAVTSALALSIAQAKEAKRRLMVSKGFVLTNVHTGVELYDVVRITDLRGNQSAATYRILGITTKYSGGQFYQILELGNV